MPIATCESLLSTRPNFGAFTAAIDDLRGAKVHVHCIYNARVSAFLYRYAKGSNALSEWEAFAIMESIWRPGNDWAAFIGNEEAIGQPNRYAGTHY